jgi:hypothetical protein
MKIDVVRPTENFRGMSYSEWTTIWSNWLFSEDPDTYCFLEAMSVTNLLMIQKKEDLVISIQEGSMIEQVRMGKGSLKEHLY